MSTATHTTKLLIVHQDAIIVSSFSSMAEMLFGSAVALPRNNYKGISEAVENLGFGLGSGFVGSYNSN